MNKILNIDRRIVAFVTDTPGASVSAISASLSDTYSPPYVRFRIQKLGNDKAIRIDRVKGLQRTAVYFDQGIPERPPAPCAFVDDCGTRVPGFDEVYARYRALPWLNRERCADIYQAMIESYLKTGTIPDPINDAVLQVANSREWAFWDVAYIAISEG